jgi:DNA-binding response OmpR family regulator
MLTALELGAVEYVSKPFSVPVLMERIDQLLERSS